MKVPGSVSVDHDSTNFSVCGTAENNPGNLFLGKDLFIYLFSCENK